MEMIGRYMREQMARVVGLAPLKAAFASKYAERREWMREDWTGVKTRSARGMSDNTWALQVACMRPVCEWELVPSKRWPIS